MISIRKRNLLRVQAGSLEIGAGAFELADYNLSCAVSADRCLQAGFRCRNLAKEHSLQRFRLITDL